MMSSSFRPSNPGRTALTLTFRASVPSVASTRLAMSIRTNASRNASASPRTRSTAILAARTRPIAV